MFESASFVDLLNISLNIPEENKQTDFVLSGTIFNLVCFAALKLWYGMLALS